MLPGIFILDLLTASSYVVGFLYVALIVYASTRLGRLETISLIGVTVILTFINIWFPQPDVDHLPSLVNRSIAALTLLLTGFLCDRNRCYQETLAQNQENLQAQINLDRLREDFATTLAHDLKTPFLAAIEILSAIHNQKFGPISSAQAQVLEKMSQSHKTSLVLVETLLDVYRNDLEGLTLNLSLIDLSSLTQEVVNHLTELAGSRNLRIKILYHGAEQPLPFWVEADSLQLQRVLTNLLTNAIKYSQRGGQIQIELETLATDHVVRILDAGSGLKLEDFPYLFERFYQGDGNRLATGTGLGLYLARQIVDAHGGAIWAQNREQSGAVFGFKLPIISAPLGLERDHATANSIS